MGKEYELLVFFFSIFEKNLEKNLFNMLPAQNNSPKKCYKFMKELTLEKNHLCVNYASNVLPRKVIWKGIKKFTKEKSLFAVKGIQNVFQKDIV